MTSISPHSDGTSSPRRWVFFAVVSLGLLMVTLDNSILYTALPVLGEKLGATPSEQLWIINAYLLVLVGLIMGMGTLGDRIGHRKMFLTGLAIFGGASLACAYAPNAWMLILSRGVLGLGAAIMMPSTLALIRVTFPDERERNLAIGIWSSIAVVGAATGPIAGGFLLEHFWWGSIFLINVPIVLIALAMTLAIAPPNIPNPNKHWDVLSSLYALIALSGFTLVLKQGAAGEVTGAVIGSVFLAVGGTLFTRRQRRLSDPMLTFDIFRSPVFLGGVIAASGSMFALGGMEILTTQNLQLAQDFTPLAAGVVVASAAVTALPFSAVGGGLLHRIGFRPLISGGFSVITVGILLCYLGSEQDLLPLFVAGLMLAGVGVGSVLSVSSIAIVGSAPVHRAGMAAGVEEVSYEIGMLTAIAITGSLQAALFEAKLPENLREQGTEALYNDATQPVAAAAFTDAYHVAVLVTAGAALAFALMTARLFRGNPKSGEVLAHATTE